MVAHNDPLSVIIRNVSGQLQQVNMTISSVPRPAGSPVGTRYHVAPKTDLRYLYDETTFVAEQEYISEENLPLIMGLLTSPANSRTKPRLDTVRKDVWGKPFRHFPSWLLPTKISCAVEGWRVAYWQRAGKPYDIQLRDILARMDSRLFEEGGPLNVYTKNMNSLRNRVEMRVQRYYTRSGVPTLSNGQAILGGGYSDQMLKRIDELSDDQVLHDTIWTLAVGEDGKKYIEQPGNPWDCFFELPAGLPLREPSTSIKAARKRIREKKALLPKQFEENEEIKYWWMVKLPGQQKRKRARNETPDNSKIPSNTPLVRHPNSLGKSTLDECLDLAPPFHAFEPSARLPGSSAYNSTVNTLETTIDPAIIGHYQTPTLQPSTLNTITPDSGPARSSYNGSIVTSPRSALEPLPSPAYRVVTKDEMESWVIEKLDKTANGEDLTNNDFTGFYVKKAF